MDRVYLCVEAVDSSALYEVSMKYASGLSAVAVNGESMTGSLGPDDVDYFSVDADGVDYGISIMIWSMDRRQTAPRVYISRRHRHPSGNDTQCASESELNGDRSVCTMAYTAASGGHSRAIYLDTDWFGGTLFMAIASSSEGEAMRYRLVCSSRASALELGVPVNGIAVERSWKYYILEMTSSSTVPLVVDVTLLSGSTRSYVTNSMVDGVSAFDALNDETRRAIDNGSDNATAIAFSGSHSVTLSESVDRHFYCRDEAASGGETIDEWLAEMLWLDGWTEPVFCEYFIAIFAAADSQFVVNVHFEDELVPLDPDGAPSSGRLTANRSTAYYYLVVTEHTEHLEVVLTDLDAVTSTKSDYDLELYLNVDDGSGPTEGDLTRPNRARSQYSSKNGSLRLIGAKAATYYIAVQCAADSECDDFYSIEAASRRRVLTENVPVFMSTAGGDGDVFYFLFNVLRDGDGDGDGDGDESEDIEILVQSETVRGALFSVSVSSSEVMAECFESAECPSPSSCDGTKCVELRSRNGDHPVVIESGSSVHCQYAASSSLCAYFVAVAVEEESVTDSDSESERFWFSVTARSERVRSGVLSFGGAAVSSSFIGRDDDEYHFYTLYLAESAHSAEVTLESCLGAVELFVSSKTVFATKLTAEWESAGNGQLDVVTIPDLEWPRRVKALYIGVRDVAPSRDSEYALSGGVEVDRFRPRIERTDLVVSSSPRIGEAAVRFKMKRFPDSANITVVGYALYFGDDTNPYSMSSHCGLRRMKQQWTRCSAQSAATNSCSVDLELPPIDRSDSVELTVGGLQPDSLYSFNVELQTTVRLDGDPQNEETLYTLYWPQSTRILAAKDVVAVTAHSDNATVSALELAVAITVPLLFLLLGVALFYYKKHDRVQRDLAVLEMEEVPLNKMVKAIGGTQFADDHDIEFTLRNGPKRSKSRKRSSSRSRGSAKKYHSLLSNADDDDDDEEDDHDERNGIVDDEQGRIEEDSDNAGAEALTLHIGPDHDDNE